MSRDIFDNDSQYSKKYMLGELTDESLKRAEKRLGYKFPKSYVLLLSIQNGGVISNRFDSWLEVIYGVAQEGYVAYGIESKFVNWMNEWEYPNIGIPFGETQSAGHDMYFFDFRSVDESGEPRIVRINNEEDNTIYFVANNFEEFIKMVYNGENIDGVLINS